MSRSHGACIGGRAREWGSEPESYPLGLRASLGMWLCRCCRRRRGSRREELSDGEDGWGGDFAPGMRGGAPVAMTLTEEKLEEARMLSGMEADVVRKLYSRFVQGLQIDPDDAGAGAAKPKGRYHPVLSRLSSTFRSTSSSASRYSLDSEGAAAWGGDALESEEDAAVVAARIRYRRHANRAGRLTRDQFLLMPFIRHHPLKTRLADMAGFTQSVAATAPLLPAPLDPAARAHRVPDRIEEGDIRGHVGAGGRRSRTRASPAQAWSPASQDGGQAKGPVAEALAGTEEADEEVAHINRAGRRGRVKGPRTGAGAAQESDAVALPSVDFFTFVRRLAPFGSDAPLHAKLRASFQIYDWDDDGVITRSDLRHVLRRIVRVDPDSHGPNLRSILRRRMLDQGRRGGRSQQGGEGDLAAQVTAGVDGDPEVGVGVRQRGRGAGGGAEAGHVAGEGGGVDEAVEREIEAMGQNELQEAVRPSHRSTAAVVLQTRACAPSLQLVTMVVDRVMAEVGGSERQIHFQQFAHTVQLSGGDVAHQAVLALVAPSLY